MPKLKTFRVDYSFDGYGFAFVKAKSEEEAENKFYNGYRFGENEEESGNEEVLSVKMVEGLK